MSLAVSLRLHSAVHLLWPPILRQKRPLRLRVLKRLTIYGGLMYSQVNGGLASGYLNANNINPTIGLRLQF